MQSGKTLQGIVGNIARNRLDGVKFKDVLLEEVSLPQGLESREENRKIMDMETLFRGTMTYYKEEIKDMKYSKRSMEIPLGT